MPTFPPLLLFHAHRSSSSSHVHFTVIEVVRRSALNVFPRLTQSGCQVTQRFAIPWFNLQCISVRRQCFFNSPRVLSKNVATLGKGEVSTVRVTVSGLSVKVKCPRCGLLQCHV